MTIIVVRWSYTRNFDWVYCIHRFYQQDKQQAEKLYQDRLNTPGLYDVKMYESTCKQEDFIEFENYSF